VSDSLLNSTLSVPANANFDACEISEPLHIPYECRVEQLADDVVKLNANANIFSARSEGSVQFFMSVYPLFLLVQSDDDQWKRLCEMPVFKERSRMLGDEKRALAVVQFGANATSESERKVCSREANVLLYAHKQGVTAEGLENWLKVVTTAQAVDAMRKHRADCNFPPPPKRSKIIIPCDLNRGNYPHFDEACRKDLPEEQLEKILPILERAFDEIEKVLQAATFLNEHSTSDDDEVQA